MMKDIWLILITVGFVAVGQLTLKMGVTAVTERDPEASISGLLLGAAREVKVCLGLFLYVISAALWLIVLSRTELSLAYPFLALSYVIVSVSAVLTLGERLTWLQWAGVLSVSTGVVLMTFSI